MVQSKQAWNQKFFREGEILVELWDFDEHLLKTQEKKAPHGKVLEFFVLWIRAFIQNQGTFSDFQIRAGEATHPSCTPVEYLIYKYQLDYDLLCFEIRKASSIEASFRSVISAFGTFRLCQYRMYEQGFRRKIKHFVHSYLTAKKLVRKALLHLILLEKDFLWSPAHTYMFTFVLI